MGHKSRKFALSCLTLSVIGVTSFVFHATQSYSKNLAMGQRLFEQGEYRRALSRLTEALQTKPSDTNVRTYLAAIYDQLGQRKQVLQELEALAELDHNNLDVLLWLADLYAEFNEFEKAQTYYVKYLIREKTPDVQMKLAQVLAWQDKLDQAVFVLERLPETQDNLAFLADVYTWNQQYEQAAGIYRTLLDLVQTEPDMILKLADVLRYARRDKEAVVQYKKYLKLYDAL